MENQHIDSVAPNGSPNRPPAETPQQPDFIPQVPPPVTHKTERTYSSPDPTPLWKIILEVGAVAVGIGVALIYYGQLQVMRGQLGEIIRQFPEIQKSAKAARDSADLSQKTLNETTKNFRIDERAWLAPGIIKESTPINPQSGHAMCNFSIGNFGKTQALKLQGKLMAAVLPKGTKHIPFESAISVPFNPSVIYPNIPQEYGVGIVRQFEAGKWGGVTWDQIIPSLHNGEASLLGYGKISYQDIFDNTVHVVTFCDVLVSGFVPTKIGHPSFDASLRQQCADYNRAYDER
jgi:hypothetical protein